MASSPAAGQSSSAPLRPATPPIPKSGNGRSDNTLSTHVVYGPPQPAFPSININDEASEVDEKVDEDGLHPSTSYSPGVASTPIGSPGLLAPANLKPGLLRPDFPTPADMAEDDPPSAGGSIVPSPFNFQTQVISTSPVKSVCSDIHHRHHAARPFHLLYQPIDR